MLPDADVCYRAVQGRDPRFDGWFVTAVRTTGIYCRPSCPASTPRRTNVDFYPSAAAAQRIGFRACKRCRPDASPGSPDWDIRGDLAGRALRLVGDGVIDREGVPGLARQLGYSARQIHRTLVAEVGAGPVALARAQRAQTARILLETTDLPVTDVAFTAGFSSVRQFNDTVRTVFAITPSELRSRRHVVRRSGTTSSPGVLTLRLAYRRPMDVAGTLTFLGRRAVAGVESYDGATLRRVLRLPGGAAVVELTDGGGFIRCQLRLTDHRDLTAAVSRIRRWLDLDADPTAVDTSLARDPRLAPLVDARPGIRCPGSVDGFEMAVRAVVGQQISVRGARTVLGRIVERAGTVAFRDEQWRLFPTAEQLAAMDPAELPMPRRRAATLHALAAATTSGTVRLDPGADRDIASAAVRAVPGVGPWTADYLRMRALADPDVLLDTDLGVRAAARALGLDLTDRRPDWAPWRSYATTHLWATLP